MISEFLDLILTWIAAHPGWMGLAIFLTALGESLAIVGMLVPGALMMFGFGALITLGHLEFWTACGWAVAGAIAGDGISFWLGRTCHQRLRRLWPFYKHPEMLARGEAFFKRHGGKSVLFGRFFGPVRAVIPAVAGMLDMPIGRYMAANIGSAVLWAPAYLLPGMVFAASLELASQVAWRLVVLILLVVGLLWFTAWLVRRLFRLLQPRVHGWLKRFSAWSRERRWLGPVSASLLDPAQGELRGLVTIAVLLLCIAILATLLLSATGQNLPTTLDHGLHRFLQELRTPWADNLMVFITELGDYQVKLALAAAVFAWLCWQQARSAAIHWLLVLGFGMVTSLVLQVLFQIQRPVEAYPVAAYQDISVYSFPSNHAAMSTILLGFLAVLIARETAPSRRWLPYMVAALGFMTIAFSRLYLGVHWLSDVLVGMSQGLVWVILIGMAYNYRPARPLKRNGLLAVSLTAFIVAGLLHTSRHHAEDLYHYRARPTIQTIAQEDWWQHNWRRLPTHRIDFRGKSRQALVLQWAAPREELEWRLRAAGWQPAPPLALKNSLMLLNPQAQLINLPVLPRVHDGQHDDLILTRPGDAPDTRWVLRFWDAEVRLQDSKTPIWLGSLTLQRLEQPMPLFTIARDVPTRQPPRELLAAALQGLRSQAVITPDFPGGITLVVN